MMELQRVDYSEGSAELLAAQLVEDVSDLVSPPDVCLKVFALLDSGDASAQDFGEVICRDPSLTAKLLRLVNSSFYNFPQSIDTVTRAIALLGIRELHNLVIAVSSINTFSRLPASLVNMDTFWRHGIYTGLIARRLAKTCGVLHPERMFVAGMLHDIGSLVLCSRMPERMQELLLIADGDEDILHHAEQESLGFSHAQLGGGLARVWCLPDSLQTAIAFHHTPSRSPSPALETGIVHLADALANRSEIGAYCETSGGDGYIDPALWTILGVEPDCLELDEIVGQAGLEFGETANLLLTRS